MCYLLFYYDCQDLPNVLDADKATLRAQLVPSIISLAGASDKAIRAQVAETVAVIAKYDFPEQWSELVDVRPS